MKNLFFFLIISFFTNYAFAQLTYVPDDEFEAHLEAQGWGNQIANDDYVNTASISNVTTLNIFNKNIADLTGIEDFTSLTILKATNNQLTTLDLSNNLYLESVSCGNNQLTTLDFSTNLYLENITCPNNQLTTLNVSNLVNLSILKCENNNLSTLDVSDNINLTELITGNNQLTSLDISNLVKLTRLHCERNYITALDLTNKIELRILRCFYNQLSSLDASNSPNLHLLFVSHNSNLSCLITDNGSEAILMSANYNPNLYCIQVNDLNLVHPNSIIGPGASYSTDCSSFCNTCSISANASSDVTVYPGVAVQNSPNSCSEPADATPDFSCTTLTATATEATEPLTYLWSNGASTASIDVCPSSPTSYSVTITDADACTATDEVMVNTCDITSNNGNSVTVMNPNGKTITINMNALGAHLCNGAVLDVSTNGCDGSNFRIETPIVEAINVYPNPSINGMFKIEFPDYENGYLVEVMNIEGKIIQTKNVENHSNTIKISVSEKGIYFIRTSNNEYTEIHKVIYQ